MSFFALWMMWVSSNANGAAPISSYPTLEACKKAATEAVYIGAPGAGPTYSFVCIQSGRG
jgi:hypothetical protein